ncbi:hypothetical protein SAMN04489761_0278 [Tenacibaculum sp. MAR_2009_124]|uniref:hypothetical protein n=1 Tax=Tenacibaculum sp. MAR_2009_124 TaxID=1250059 RepID=UPI00089B882C|nr:hypothetical protein [Tenacibaculum sp. MAR_2009_124]SEB37732.1 hypothetical protein SAMN04489761_0278 [Tenacibaculum sp. MAR_2009_124]
MERIKNQTSIIKSYTLSKNRIDYEDLMPQLEGYFGEVPLGGKDTFINIPMVVAPFQIENLDRLSQLLNEAIQKIVSNYFNDVRIRNIYQLDKGLESILKQAESVPYKVGMYRPDFIFDKNGQPKICEIGCRYPINGWMLSYYTRLIFDKLSTENNMKWIDVYESNQFLTTISKDFNVKKTVYYVHDLEGGTEAYQFFNELANIGFTVKDISPKELTLKNGKLSVNDQIADQFIVEMDREELKQINPKIRQALIESEKCLNDFRTLILVHDKRVLSVLFDDEIMGDYLETEDYNFLKRFLIPSYILDSEEKRNKFIHLNKNCLLKKNSGGRGIGIYVKNECSSETWEKVILNQWKEYMLQEYVDQKVFNIEREGETKNVNMVGMLLCYDNKSYGPGIFRASSKSIINVHSGGYILPTVISKES